MVGNIPGEAKWYGGAINKNGEIFCAPFNSSKILKIDTKNNKLTQIDTLRQTEFSNRGAVTLPDGSVVFIPHNSTQIIRVSDSSDKLDFYGNFQDELKWIGGVLASNGRVYCAPSNSTQVLVIDSGLSCDDYGFVASRYFNKL